MIENVPLFPHWRNGEIARPASFAGSWFIIIVMFLFGLCTLITPASAADYTLTGYQEYNVFDVEKTYFSNVNSVTFDQSENDKAITLIHFKVPQGHTVQFTIYYGFGNSVSGYASNDWNVSFWPAQSTTSTINFNGETKTYSYVDTNPEFDYYLSGYARDTTSNQTGLIVYSAGYGGFDNDLAIFKPVSSLPTNLIYRVDLSGDAAFDADISFGSKADVAATVSKDIFEVAGEWIEFATAIAGGLFNFATSFYYWIKFFFIDNLGLTVSVYMMVTLAFAARRSPGNMARILRTWINDQKNLYKFIIEMWNLLVDTISQFRAIFRI